MSTLMPFYVSILFSRRPCPIAVHLFHISLNEIVIDLVSRVLHHFPHICLEAVSNRTFKSISLLVLRPFLRHIELTEAVRPYLGFKGIVTNYFLKSFVRRKVFW